MRTTRERTNRGRSRERGIVGLVLLGLIVVAMAVAAFFFVARKQNEKTPTADNQNASENNSTDAEAAALQSNQVNTVRRSDAARLLSATAEYQANNTGSLPTQIHDYMLDGLEYYKAADIANGQQSALSADELRLVTGAECSESGTTVAASSPRMHAVQFVIKASDGSLTPQCQNG